MKLSVKGLVLFTSAVIALSAITGCSGSEGSSSSSAVDASSGAAKSSGSEDAGKELVVVSWGGANQDAQRESIFKAFEKKTGVKIKEDSPTDYGKLTAMVNSGNVEWDVVDCDADFVPRGIKEGLLEKLDFNVIDKTDLDTSLTTDYSVGAELYAVAISYDTTTFPTGKQPTTWAQFWDTKSYPGGRALWKYAPSTLEIALLADGVKPEELYPLDVERAFKSLDKIKKDINVWWTTGAQPAQLLTDNEVALAGAWNGRITSAKEQGASVDVEFNQSILMADSWVVVKGAPQKDLAMKFIAFATAPEQQANYAKLIPYGVVNSKAYDLLDEATKAKMASSPEKRPKQIMLDVNYWLDNYDTINERFQNWLIK